MVHWRMPLIAWGTSAQESTSSRGIIAFWCVRVKCLKALNDIDQTPLHSKSVIDLPRSRQSEPIRSDAWQSPLILHEVNSSGPSEFLLAHRNLVDQMSTPRPQPQPLNDRFRMIESATATLQLILLRQSISQHIPSWFRCSWRRFGRGARCSFGHHL